MFHFLLLKDMKELKLNDRDSIMNQSFSMVSTVPQSPNVTPISSRLKQTKFPPPPVLKDPDEESVKSERLSKTLGETLDETLDEPLLRRKI